MLFFVADNCALKYGKEYGKEVGRMMARTLHRLSSLEVSRRRNPGLLADGGNLYLAVSSASSKSWIFRYKRDGKTKDMGLGSLNAVSLQQARKLASSHRDQLANGIDPLVARSTLRLKAAADTAKSMTFREAAETYMRAQEPSWRNPKHRKQWHSTLESYVYPVFGDVSVAAVDVGMVLRAVEPIWNTKTETASRVRGRIESVLDWATARGLRTGDNPARWRGHLQNLLPARKRIHRVKHHTALAYPKIGNFMEVLRTQDGVSPAALEFLILTAARTGEVIGAGWSEIDMDTALWVVPADRIKAGKEHRVPLSAPAMKILRRMVKLRGDSDLVFPGRDQGRGLSNMAMLSLLDRMGHGDLTAHGFRSTFRDWAAETTNHPRDVAEMALAHGVSSDVEAAYRRGDMFEKRRRLMKDWASYCERIPQGDNVVQITAEI